MHNANFTTRMIAVWKILVGWAHLVRSPMPRQLGLLLWLLAPASAFGAFGLTGSGGYYTVDTAGGLVFKVNQANGDITSLVYNGVEYQYALKSSQINSGLGTATTTVTATMVGTDSIKISVSSVVNSSSGGTLTHYYMARRGYSHIYMATYFTDEPDIGLVRFIVRIPNSLLPNGPTPSEIYKTDSTIEASDVFAYSAASPYTALIGQTRAKHYSNHRLMDWSYTGATGSNVAAWMVRSNHEGDSGGPFFRCLINQCGDQQELYEILNYGEGQTEAFRYNVLNGPYTLVFTNGVAPGADGQAGTPPTLDTTWVASMGLTGFVTSAARGTVTCAGISNRDTSYSYTVGFANAAAQHWTSATTADGAFTKPDMLPGTYTMSIYKNELAVYRASVTVTAGGTTTLSPITLTADPSSTVPLWRIGNWDGSPAEFLNADKVTTMHPSDVRMSAWNPGIYTVGTSAAATGMPCYQWKGVAGGSQTIQFNLTANQIAASTVRVGITCGYSGGRPNIGVNAWTAGLQSASTQPTSRTLTVGTYRGNNTTYSFAVPASALVLGTNSLYLYPISGNTYTAPYLSPGYSLDCVEVTQGTPQTLAVPAAPTAVTGIAVDAQALLSWGTASGTVTYNVRRSTSPGGPYTTVASGVGAASYTDTGLTNGVTYYYVLSATNTSGTGVNSAETGVTPAAPTLTWSGAVDSTWNTTTYNWKLAGVDVCYGSGATVAFTDTGNAASAINLAANVSPATTLVNSSSNYTFAGAGVITGTTTLAKAGGGTLALTGIHTFSGAVAVSGGTLAITQTGSGAAAISAAAGTGAITLSGGGTFKMGSSDGKNFPNNPIAVAPATTAMLSSVSLTNAYGGLITGASDSVLTLSGPVSMNVSGSAQFGGFGGTAVIPAGSQLRFSSSSGPNGNGGANATFQVDGTLNTRNAGGTNGVVLGALSGGGFIYGQTNTAAGTVTYNIGAKNLATSFSGVIANGSIGTASITKLGSGVLTLSGANTYTGATTLTAGKLSVTGALAATATSIASGAALGGTGSIAGAVTCNGSLAPGVTTGTLTLGGGLTLTSTSTLDYDLGTSSDRTAVAGNLTLDGTLNVTAAAGFTAGTYTLITYTGTLTNNTLAVGSLPAGCAASVSTATAGQVNLVVTGTRSYNSWVSANFTPAQITAGESAPDADPDHDGLTNLAEYALGGLPYSFTAQPLTVVSGTSLTITFQRPAWLSDVTYHAEVGTDLANWSELALERLNPGSDPETLRATYPSPAPGTGPHFIRLRCVK